MFEKRLSTAAGLREDPEVLEQDVTEGAELRTVECLNDETMGSLPWDDYGL